MKLSTLLDENLIFLEESFDNYDDILKFLSQKFADETSLKSDIIYDAFIEREKSIPTFLGKRVSLPHTKFDNFDNLKIALVTLKNPIKVHISTTDTDEELKYVISILASTKMPDFYIKVLGVLSEMCLTKLNILDSETPEELIKEVKSLGLTTGKHIVAKDLAIKTPSVSKDATIAEVLVLLKEYKVNAIPVVEDDKIVGIMDIKHIIKYSLPDYVLNFEDFSFVNSDFQPLETLWENEQNISISKFIDTTFEHQKVLWDAPYAEILFLFAKFNNVYLIIVDENDQYIGIVQQDTVLDKILLP